MSRVSSSFQTNDPGSLTSCAPLCFCGCQIETYAPVGSKNPAIRPESKISIGGTTALPPLSCTAFIVASASATEMYVDQGGGWSGDIVGPPPATSLPFSVNMP